MTKNSKAHKADLRNYMREYMRRRRAAKAVWIQPAAQLIKIVNMDLGQPLAVRLFFENTDATPPTFVTSPLSLT
jgi:hypothetical protein